MKWNSIVFKWGATIFILLISVLLPLIFTIDRLFYKSYLSEAHYQINQLAAQYSDSLSSLEDIETLQTAARLTKTEICIYF
jgi:ABC-type transport system involved in cytochrome bd biosynthesis fused ATPase/permease subunit